MSNDPLTHSHPPTPTQAREQNEDKKWTYKDADMHNCKKKKKSLGRYGQRNHKLTSTNTTQRTRKQTNHLTCLIISRMAVLPNQRRTRVRRDKSTMNRKCKQPQSCHVRRALRIRLPFCRSQSPSALAFFYFRCCSMNSFLFFIHRFSWVCGGQEQAHENAANPSIWWTSFPF